MALTLELGEILKQRSKTDLVHQLKKHKFPPKRYQALAICLLSTSSLNEIKKRHPEEDEEFLSQCLSSWLQKAESTIISKDTPTICSLNKALLQIGEDDVADRIHKEKHPACFILLHYEEQIKVGVLKCYLFLHRSGLLPTMVLSASPTEREQAIMNSLKESVCLNHHNLEKLARILQAMLDDTEMIAIGSKILEEYRQKYTVSPGYWVTVEPDVAGVYLYVTKKIVMEPLETIREKMNNVIIGAIQALKNVPSINIKDLKRFINRSEPALQKEMESCQTNSDVFELVSSKCSVSDIAPVESIIVQFKVQGVEPTIKEYRSSLSEFYEKLQLHSYFCNDSADQVTLLIDEDVDDIAFNDIKSLVTLYAHQFGLGLSVEKDN